MVDPVVVYRWTYINARDVETESTLYATMDMIRKGLGVAMPNSMMKVERADLRDGGIYVPTKDRAPG